MIIYNFRRGRLTSLRAVPRTSWPVVLTINFALGTLGTNCNGPHQPPALNLNVFIGLQFSAPGSD